MSQVTADGVYSIKEIAEIVNMKHNNGLISLKFNVGKSKIHGLIKVSRKACTQNHEFICNCGRKMVCSPVKHLMTDVFQFNIPITINDPLIDNERFYSIKYDFTTDTIDVN